MAKELTDAEIEAAAKRIADGIEKISKNNTETGPVKTKRKTPRSTYHEGREPIPTTKNYTDRLEKMREFNGNTDFTTDNNRRGEDSAVARLINMGRDDELSL